jgi:TolC family type I secretion outer membrane protein
MKKIILSAAAAMFGMAFIFDASAATLEEALASAYNTNPIIQGERASVRSIDENVSQAIGGWLPSITANYERGRDYLQSKSNTGGTEVYRSPDSRSITISQDVFNGFASINRTKEANSNIKAARAELVNVEQNVLFESVGAYMDVVRDLEVDKLNGRNVEILRKHLDATNDRFDLGEVTRTDVSQAKARLAAADADYAQAKGNIASSRATYLKVIGTDVDLVIMPSSSIEIPNQLNELVELAQSNHPALKNAEYSKNAASNNVRAVQGNLLPSVSLNGTYSKEKGTILASSGAIDRGSILFNVSVPIFQKGIEYSRVRQAKENFKRARANVDNIHDSIVEFSSRVWHDYNVAVSTVSANNAAVEAASIALEGVIQEYKAGSRTTLDVLDAEQELFSAKVDLITARRDKVVASYNALSAIGKLNARDLGLDVKLYDPEENYDRVKYKLVGF